MEDQSRMMSIALVGGTGKEGKGLAYRWAKAGYRILIGSRSLEKANAAVQELLDLLGGEASIQGMENVPAARQADIIVITVPFLVHRETS